MFPGFSRPTHQFLDVGGYIKDAARNVGSRLVTKQCFKNCLVLKCYLYIDYIEGSQLLTALCMTKLYAYETKVNNQKKNWYLSLLSITPHNYILSSSKRILHQTWLWVQCPSWPSSNYFCKRNIVLQFWRKETKIIIKLFQYIGNKCDVCLSSSARI